MKKEKDGKKKIVTCHVLRKVTEKRHENSYAVKNRIRKNTRVEKGPDRRVKHLNKLEKRNGRKVRST